MDMISNMESVLNEDTDFIYDMKQQIDKIRFRCIQHD